MPAYQASHARQMAQATLEHDKFCQVAGRVVLGALLLPRAQAETSKADVEPFKPRCCGPPRSTAIITAPAQHHKTAALHNWQGSNQLSHNCTVASLIMQRVSHITDTPRDPEPIQGGGADLCGMLPVR